MRSIFAANDPGRLSASIPESIFPSLMSPRARWPGGSVPSIQIWRAARFFLSDRCSIRRAPTGGDILDADGDDVTATKLAVDCQIEHCQVTSAAFDLKLRPYRPDVLGSQRRF